MKILLATALLLFGFGLTQSSHASAPQVKKLAPGYYRFMVGDIEVTPLFDGFFPMKPKEYLKGATPAEIQKYLAAAYEDQDVIMTSVNGFLINTGTKLVLIDTGSGASMGASLGHLLENLKASGYQPEQVDEVDLTHMHGDHVGGLLTEGRMTYPNAVVRADKRDADFWLSDAEAGKATDPMLKSNFATAKASLAPYQASNHFKTFEGETELVPGVNAHPAYGHTPGHTVYTVESNGKKLWLLGDMIHVASVQFPKPSAALVFDSDNQKAIAERKKVFSLAAKSGDMIGAAHLAFPGVGHLKVSGSGFVYTPLEFNSLP